MAMASIIDDALFIVVLIWVLAHLGIRIPWWEIGLLVLVLLTWSVISYRALLKNPTMGFENVTGKLGIVVEEIKGKGTVRIGHELWQARSRKTIPSGAQIKVVSQSGLNLTVESPKSQTSAGLKD
jgi:membrane-bound ClpP family serine protease